jgi:hypothetical protein
MPVAQLLSINVGLPRTVGHADAVEPFDKPWTTGFFKQPVAVPVWLGRTNLAGGWAGGPGEPRRTGQGGERLSVRAWAVLVC